MRRFRWPVAGVLSALLAAPAGAAAAAAPPLLQGSFALAGRVTAAVAIPGERPGQVVDRIWNFQPACPDGSCSDVVLTRARPRGFDTVRLLERSLGLYAGSGSFLAPLRCARRVYRPGEVVPFAVTVQVTSMAVRNGQSVATRIVATYVNSRRLNLTPCVASLGHDAARYHGHAL